MEKLIQEIKACRICEKHLPLGPRPVLSASPTAKIIIIGQAPGTKVHKSGKPWDDQSGEKLRRWMGISASVFYDSSEIAIVPMGFCYPGKGKSGDLPPRKECAEHWHEKLLSAMPKVELTLLIGGYAQNYYLAELAKNTLTESVKSYKEYLPTYFVLPHPSPRNNIWMAKNQWFERDVMPELGKVVQGILFNSK